MNTVIIHPTASNNASPLTVVCNNEPKENKAFVEANTVKATLSEIKEHHIIPTFKDSTPLISHADFVEAAEEITHRVFHPERIAAPSIRLSHPIYGRIPEAKDKPIKELQPWEKTEYFERLAFIIEIPSISDTIGGERLCLTIGGVRQYQNNLRTGSDQHFKVFIGFRIQCCCNLSVWTDGLLSNVRVKNIHQLKEAIYQLLVEHDAVSQLQRMESFVNYSLSEKQIAHFLGKARMYQYLSANVKSMYPEFLFTDSQINTMAKDYYSDPHFAREFNGELNLWKLYNLLTGANKQSYIDSLLSRAVNASSFVQGLATSLERNTPHWFLS